MFSIWFNFNKSIKNCIPDSIEELILSRNYCGDTEDFTSSILKNYGVVKNFIKKIKVSYH